VILEALRRRWRIFAYVLCAVVSATLFTCFSTVRVASISMENTLHEGDVLIVADVGFLLNGTGGNLWRPSRGQIVVFRPPISGGTQWVKRVVATGNDQVRIEKGRLILNGVAQSEPYISNPWLGDWPEAPTYSITVPERFYFVLSDNRSATFDSRSLGALPEHEITGLVVAVLPRWPWLSRVPQAKQGNNAEPGKPPLAIRMGLTSHD